MITMRTPVGQVAVRCYNLNRLSAAVVNQAISKSTLAGTAAATGNNSSLKVQATGLFFNGDICDSIIEDANASMIEYGIVSTNTSFWDYRDLIRHGRESFLLRQRLEGPLSDSFAEEVNTELTRLSRRIDELKWLLSRGELTVLRGWPLWLVRSWFRCRGLGYASISAVDGCEYTVDVGTYQRRVLVQTAFDLSNRPT